MEIEIVIAELMKLFHVESITPSQYQEAVQILFELQIPFNVKLPRHTITKEVSPPIGNRGVNSQIMRNDTLKRPISKRK